MVIDRGGTLNGGSVPRRRGGGRSKRGDVGFVGSGMGEKLASMEKERAWGVTPGSESSCI